MPKLYLLIDYSCTHLYLYIEDSVTEKTLCFNITFHGQFVPKRLGKEGQVPVQCVVASFMFVIFMNGTHKNDIKHHPQFERNPQTTSNHFVSFQLAPLVHGSFCE